MLYCCLCVCIVIVYVVVLLLVTSVRRLRLDRVDVCMYALRMLMIWHVDHVSYLMLCSSKLRLLSKRGVLLTEILVPRIARLETVCLVSSGG